MTSIKDSGNRRQFNSGAVRDVQEGKGRCDLLPLDIVAPMFDTRLVAETLSEIQDFTHPTKSQHNNLSYIMNNNIIIIIYGRLVSCLIIQKVAG